MENRRYPAKVLLFGEYTVLLGSNALAVPVPKWFGVWAFGKNVEQRLLDVIEFLKTKSTSKLDLIAFENDVLEGLHFNSNIPEGYGLGSSAALTAGIFDRYYDQPESLSIKEVVAELAVIEGCFHGESSGFDPIVSYLNHPVYYLEGEYKVVEFSHDENQPTILLVDSGVRRDTQSLVAQFKLRMHDQVYVQEVIEPTKYSVDLVIKCLICSEWTLFWASLRTISVYQQFKFKDKSPDAMKEVWKTFFLNQDVLIKLCGAGGGGYYLAFAKPGVDLKVFEGFDVEIINL